MCLVQLNHPLETRRCRIKYKHSRNPPSSQDILLPSHVPSFEVPGFMEGRPERKIPSWWLPTQLLHRPLHFCYLQTFSGTRPYLENTYLQLGGTSTNPFNHHCPAVRYKLEHFGESYAWWIMTQNVMITFKVFTPMILMLIHRYGQTICIGYMDKINSLH